MFFTSLAISLHVLIVVSVAVRVIMKRAPTGVALAWLVIVAILPLFGVLLYMLMGEKRISRTRVERIAARRPDLEAIGEEVLAKGIADIDWSDYHFISGAMNQLGLNLRGVPTLKGNTLELHSNTLEMLRAIAKDVDAAEHSVHMEFYIWHEGGEADAVVDAVERAAKRGVTCRLLVDHIGGGPWLKGELPKRLRAAGAEVLPALQTGLITTLTSRNDLRLHRKIVVIDGRVAWSGSMNLVDPRFFKQEAGVGEWIDAMVRIEGYAVIPLAMVMLSDWQVETGEPIRELLESANINRAVSAGTAPIQVIPSGPGTSDDTILQMLVAMTYAAEERLVLTTPYFVPDESLKQALRGAAARGVQVDLVLPEKLDFFLVHHASRSYFDEMLDAGVRIHAFRGGLLHTKSITVDERASMIGTVNLDVRSIWLNYEVSLFVYDADFTKRLIELQESYMKNCDLIDPEAWANRSFGQKFLENTIRLVSPLL